MAAHSLTAGRLHRGAVRRPQPGVDHVGGVPASESGHPGAVHLGIGAIQAGVPVGAPGLATAPWRWGIDSALPVVAVEPEVCGIRGGALLKMGSECGVVD